MDRRGETEEGPEGSELRLRVPNRPAYLPAVRDLAVEASRLAGLDEGGVQYVVRVVARLAAGLMDPGLDPPEDGCLEVRLRAEGGAVHAVVHDDGPPFDPRQGGRAEEFAHALLNADSPDWIAFTNQGRAGRELSALLHAPGSRVGAATTREPSEPDGDGHSLVVRAAEPTGAWLGRVPAAFTSVAPSAATAPTGDEIRIGLLEPEQAAAVSRCIFDAYRLTYFDEMMYRPAELVELNENGRMVSAVAVTADGSVAGHVALEFTAGEPEIADVAAAVTERAWRGHGIAERLVAFLVAEAGRRGMAGLWCDAVTVHPFTQRLAHAQGFVPCGFHLAFEPPTTRFFGINDQPAGRGSSVVMFRAVGGVSDAPLDVPVRHRDFVAGIYARLGVPDRLERPAPAASLPAGTGLRTALHPVLEVARLTVDAVGTDLAERLHTALHDALREGARVVEARVNLQAAGAATACDELERMGFLVTGVLPGGSRADWLLLQFHKGIAVDYEGMVVDADDSRALLAVVRAGDPGAP